MKSFVKIESLFSKTNERTIHFLKQAYANQNNLKQIISNLINEELIQSNFLKGKKILIKPNWVLHNRKPEDALCLRTHENFILAALELILEVKPKQVIIGDAPIQGCNWDRMLPSGFYKTIENLSLAHKIPVFIKDFRRVTFSPDKNNPIKERNPISDYLIFDMGKESYLDPISSSKKNIFRVTNYNPDRLAISHTKGVHKYCITKELFEADVIISMPKLKTHQKTGITAALKNIVGLNGDKDFLPHHRIGGTGFGGDCYPGGNYLRYWAELALDQANRNQGKLGYWFYSKLSAALWRFSSPGKVHQLAAGWYGNDTTWRMVLDLNKIAIFGRADGKIDSKPQRILYSLSDGIIGGQGDGPLNPLPLPLGLVTFTNNSALHDWCVGEIFGFDVEKIPLLKHSKKELIENQVEIILNEEKAALENCKKIKLETQPPPGWVEYLK